jgi:FkbM family methyltransferase
LYSNRSVDWNDFTTRIEVASRGAADLVDIPKEGDAGEVITKNGHDWQVMFNGLRMRAGSYYGDWMTELIKSLKGFHEPQEEKVFHAILEVLDEPEAMIEVGAYWGWYSLWFKHRHPSAKAILTEPDPANLAVAASNAMENQLEVTLELGGIGKIDKSQTAGAPFLRFSDNLLIPSIDVEAMMEKHGLKTLSVLHADIQGAELPLLHQIETLLAARRIEHLFISTHWDSLHLQCREILQAHGYHFVAEHTPSESFTIDGLLVARSPKLPPMKVTVSRNIA